MGMFRTRINLEVTEYVRTQTVLRQHAFHRIGDHESGFTLEHLGRGSETLTARITRVTHIDLVGQFLACEFYFVGIDDHN